MMNDGPFQPSKVTDAISNAALAGKIPHGEGHLAAMRGEACEMAVESWDGGIPNGQRATGDCHLRGRRLDK